MRVNVYAEEMTDRIEIIGKEIDGHTFTGLRFYLELPVTLPAQLPILHGEKVKVSHGEGYQNVSGPFEHRPGDDDSAAVTFWGKRDLREVLRKALAMLDEHYGDVDCNAFGRDVPTVPINGSCKCHFNAKGERFAYAGCFSYHNIQAVGLTNESHTKFRRVNAAGLSYDVASDASIDAVEGGRWL
jgi:hypothetical protein